MAPTATRTRLAAITSHAVRAAGENIAILVDLPHRPPGQVVGAAGPEGARQRQPGGVIGAQDIKVTRLPRGHRFDGAVNLSAGFGLLVEDDPS